MLDVQLVRSFVYVSFFLSMRACISCAGSLPPLLPSGPTFFSTLFNCLGTVCGDSYVLDDEDASVAFPVLVRRCDTASLHSRRHKNVSTNVRLLLLFSASQSDTFTGAFIPGKTLAGLPPRFLLWDTRVHFNGMGCYIFPSGSLAVELGSA